MDQKGELLLESSLTDFHKTWYVGSGRHKCYPSDLSSLSAHILFTSFANDDDDGDGDDNNNNTFYWSLL